MNRFLMLALTTFALSTVSWSVEPEIKDDLSSSPRLSADTSLRDGLIVNPIAPPPTNHHHWYSGLLSCIGGEGIGSPIISQQEIENINAQHGAEAAQKVQEFISTYGESTINKILPLIEKYGPELLTLIEKYGPAPVKSVESFFQKHSDISSVSSKKKISFADLKDVLEKYGSEIQKIVTQYGPKVINLIKQYGPELVQAVEALVSKKTKL